MFEGGEPEKDLSFDHVIGYWLRTLLEKHGWETTMVLQRDNFSALEFQMVNGARVQIPSSGETTMVLQRNNFSALEFQTVSGARVHMLSSLGSS